MTAEKSAAKFYPNQIAYLRGKRYETEKKMVTNAKGVNQYTGEVGLQNANQPKTSEAIADEYGVNQSTIIRNSQFSRVVDKLPEGAKHNVLSGAETIRTVDASTILKFDKPTQKKFLKEKNGITFLTIWRRNFEP